MSTQISTEQIQQNLFNARKTAEYLISQRATLLDHCFNQAHQQILYFEHPQLGDEGYVFAMIFTPSGVYATQTGFYDTGDFSRGSDYNYVWIQQTGEFKCFYQL